jgi:membrane-anchored glycerophosphoryl diester phosphodiesterase (GDPDase)
MIGPQRALFRDLKQVQWALLLIYLILACTGFLFAEYNGVGDALLVCLAIALLAAVSFVSIFLFDRNSMGHLRMQGR